MSVLLTANFLRNARGLILLGASINATTNVLRFVNTADNYVDDVAAAAGGVPVGGLYHTSGTVKVRLA